MRDSLYNASSVLATLIVYILLFSACLFQLVCFTLSTEQLYSSKNDSSWAQKPHKFEFDENVIASGSIQLYSTVVY